MWNNANRSDLEIAWDDFKNILKQEQPFKTIYEMIIRFLDWLAIKLR
jgi:hypothetical protein